ncbi:hypothetical protein KO488_10970 [Poseidonibacter lekithochrous]|uniref:hypothetical protein n=1 Tax=Poseidonibacter TaxID=2321187 RepID=UPI001C091F9C|nr:MULTISPECIES: hypothetical protein [Poseidonibacter]MBU3015282.1 hypothetical protein [Poseidonibacter lekithochrous]MDO6828580.1 hypothetical protein [Poseidonibacter sp. 1_MG-2023]
MGAKKFITKVTEFLGLEVMETTKKKKTLKKLIKNLENKQNQIHKSLNKKINKKRRKLLEEEAEIVSIHLKKGREILHELISDK